MKRKPKIYETLIRYGLSLKQALGIHEESQNLGLGGIIQPILPLNIANLTDGVITYEELSTESTLQKLLGQINTETGSSGYIISGAWIQNDLGDLTLALTSHTWKVVRTVMKIQFGTVDTNPNHQVRTAINILNSSSQTIQSLLCDVGGYFDVDTNELIELEDTTTYYLTPDTYTLQSQTGEDSVGNADVDYWTIEIYYEVYQ